MSWTTSLATSISFKSLNRLWKSIANSEATYSIVAKKKEFGRFCRLAALRPVSMGSKHSEGDHSSWSSDFDVKLLENSSKFEVQIVTHEQGAVSEKNNRKVWLLPISAHPKSASRFYPIAFTLSNAVDGVLADSVRSLSFRLSKQSPRRKRPRFSNWPNEPRMQTFWASAPLTSRLFLLMKPNLDKVELLATSLAKRLSTWSDPPGLAEPSETSKLPIVVH